MYVINLKCRIDHQGLTINLKPNNAHFYVMNIVIPPGVVSY